MSRSYPSAQPLLLLVLALAVAATAADASLCILQLAIRGAQSNFVGGGKTTAPFPAVITTSRLNATGFVFLSVPSAAGCPPDLTASNAEEVLQQASLVQPIGEKGISYTPKDIKGDVNTSSTNSIAVFDLNAFQLGYSGNQPLANGSVVLGTASAAEALKAAQPICAQQLLLDGLLNLTAPALGERTSNVTNVAFNRTLAVGASVRKTGDQVTDITLALKNASLLLNITPEGTPGVEFSRATYLLSGNVIATADLSEASSWIEVEAADADWSRVPRLDAPVVLGTNEEPIPRYVGVNDTQPQECSVAPGEAPAAAAAAGGAPAPASAPPSPATGAAAALGRSLWSAAATFAGAAVLALAL